MYDSRKDTLDHINSVQTYLEQFMNALHNRLALHDRSKLQEPEKPLFDEYTPRLTALTYGSDEYAQALEEMGVALRHHYRVNSHHPEHYAQQECDLCFKKFSATYSEQCPGCGNGGFSEINGVNVDGMNLIDVVEMLADWKAATERHPDGDMLKSLEINASRFKLSPQLYSIFKNTIEEMAW